MPDLRATLTAQKIWFNPLRKRESNLSGAAKGRAGRWGRGFEGAEPVDGPVPCASLAICDVTRYSRTAKCPARQGSNSYRPGPKQYSTMCLASL